MIIWKNLRKKPNILFLCEKVLDKVVINIQNYCNNNLKHFYASDLPLITNDAFISLFSYFHHLFILSTKILKNNK